MKIVLRDLPVELETVEIELFFDLHIGSKKCDMKTIQKRIERVRDNENVFAILGGDILNNSTKSSVGDVYTEKIPPREQVKMAIELFKPIADKILCFTAGNHERRTYRESGDDLCEHIAFGLNCLEQYDYCSTLLFLKHGKCKEFNKRRTRDGQLLTSIYVTHGDGQGGRTIGGKANGLERRGQIVNSDIVITGHTHAPISFREKNFFIDHSKRTVVARERLFINASSALEYEEYAELQGMKPSTKISPRIVLESGKEPRVIM